VTFAVPRMVISGEREGAPAVFLQPTLSGCVAAFETDVRRKRQVEGTGSAPRLDRARLKQIAAVLQGGGPEQVDHVLCPLGPGLRLNREAPTDRCSQLCRSAMLRVKQVHFRT
jgi:hypothetical protein